MVNTPCTIDGIKLKTVANGSKYEGPVDYEGFELLEIQLTLSDEPTQRIYFCTNCNYSFDGSKTFDEAKSHLGTFPVHKVGNL